MATDKLAVQMFTVRGHTKTAAELADTLNKISEIGYNSVQLSAVGAMQGENPEVNATEAKRMLDDHGLSCIATHRPWPALLNDTENEIEFHKELDCNYVAIGGIPGDMYNPTADGYRQFLRDAEKVISRLKKEGIQFGHHNHSHEFTKTSSQGPRLEDIIINEGGEDLMLELDLYWIQNAGVNPERILERSRGRVPVIHLKDKEVIPEEGPVMAPIGEGNMDWQHIIPACEDAGVKWYAVEQDTCRRDPFDCLKSSYDFLRSFGL